MSRVAEFPVTARAHLAVLSAHLASASLEPTELFGSAALELNCVSAQTFDPPPPNLKGSLTIVDERTSRSYQVQASDEGTVKATDLKKKTCDVFVLDFGILLSYGAFERTRDEQREREEGLGAKDLCIF
ncbi:hypothetical protein L484_016799 [Morus notabilis]|uniref:Uncharacterized protein n=1 Tax=Morus notabilis TaxID=981085 RepID=W9STA1_9ROSA|nr:hypothetical protein L484_016799 [Morus notabilis]